MADDTVNTGQLELFDTNFIAVRPRSTGKWLPVIGYEGIYEVSDGGRIRSVRYGRELKPATTSRARVPRVALVDHGQRSDRTVAELVLEAFSGPRPIGKYARYHDENPLNVTLANLFWGPFAVVHQGGHKVGEVINGRELVAYCGIQRKEHVWKWTCQRCSRINGPMSLGSITAAQGWGCLDCMVGENHPSWRGHGEIPRTVLSQYQAGALARGLAWDVSAEYLSELWSEQRGRCAYTGWELQFREPRTASLNRIDSSRGYEIGNVQWVHVDINQMKWTLSDSSFRKLCQAVVTGVSIPESDSQNFGVSRFGNTG